jgi:hypothetical protein
MVGGGRCRVPRGHATLAVALSKPSGHEVLIPPGRLLVPLESAAGGRRSGATARLCSTRVNRRNTAQVQVAAACACVHLAGCITDHYGVPSLGCWQAPTAGAYCTRAADQHEHCGRPTAWGLRRGVCRTVRCRHPREVSPTRASPGSGFRPARLPMWLGRAGAEMCDWPPTTLRMPPEYCVPEYCVLRAQALRALHGPRTQCPSTARLSWAWMPEVNLMT